MKLLLKWQYRYLSTTFKKNSNKPWIQKATIIKIKQRRKINREIRIENDERKKIMKKRYYENIKKR